MANAAPKANALKTDKLVKAAKSDKRSRGELSRILLQPADNGYMVHASFDPKNPGGEYPDDETTLHMSAQSAQDHVGQHLQQHEKLYGNPAQPAQPAKKKTA